MAVWAVIAAIVSAVAAVAAVFYAWRMDRTAKGSLEASCIAAEAAKTSAAASVRSASAAERSVSLEVARRHAELTPRFRADLTPEGPGVRSPLLTLFLLGPPDLERIDELKVTIFDTKRPAAGWKEPGKPEATHIFMGVIRDLAAFCPTPRAQLRTAQTALKLHRGEMMYEEEK